MREIFSRLPYKLPKSKKLRGKFKYCKIPFNSQVRWQLNLFEILWRWVNSFLPHSLTYANVWVFSASLATNQQYIQVFQNVAFGKFSGPKRIMFIRAREINIKYMQKWHLQFSESAHYKNYKTIIDSLGRSTRHEQLWSLCSYVFCTYVCSKSSKTQHISS